MVNGIGSQLTNLGQFKEYNSLLAFSCWIFFFKQYSNFGEGSAMILEMLKILFLREIS